MCRVRFVSRRDCPSLTEFSKNVDDVDVAGSALPLHLSVDQLPIPRFYTFMRAPYETCRQHPDEKVEKQVQVARIHGETGNI